jgi:small subunit ribosomal protein S6
MKLYEGMYLVDNDVVREDWNKAKALVTGAVEKHGGKVITARRWGERRLAYPISGKLRATYLLSYFEIDKDALTLMTRDFELSEHVLRYLQLAVDVVPEAEFELAQAEGTADFTVPAPPVDDYVDEEVVTSPDERTRSAPDERTRSAPDERTRSAKSAETSAPAEEGKNTPASTTTDGEESSASDEVATEASPTEADADGSEGGQATAATSAATETETETETKPAETKPAETELTETTEGEPVAAQED